MNIKELAKLSHVSPTTVSLVLNGRECRVAKETQDRIRLLAREFSYSPNLNARNLVMKKSDAIGFVITDIKNPFFSSLTGDVEKILTYKGLSLMIVCSNGTLEDDCKKIDYLVNRGIDGLLVTLSATGGKEYSRGIVEKLNDLPIPYISVDRYIEGMNCPRVSIDHSNGGFIATQYLLNKGHKRVAIVTGPKDNYTAKRRFRGYKAALEEGGLELDNKLVFEGDYEFESGYRLTDAVVKSGATAVFISNDLMATGFERGCSELGVKIPEDISVMGFDDIFFSKMLEVPLTTVKQDLERLAGEAVKMLLARIEDNQKHFDDIKIPTTVVERKSVKQIN